jgi:Domain of unknown function (DUF4440)
MIKIFYTTLFVVILSGLLSAQSGVLADEQQRFNAMMKQDTTFLEHHLHQHLIYIHSNALLESRADFIHSVASGAIRYENIQREKAQVTRFGRTAIVNGIVRVTGLLKGQPFNIQLHYTAVYRKKRGHWQLLRWQSTRIP